ncbi:MAG TPA: hypothetical protein VFE50_08575 [Cyclobacteriaceae bacterium]|nr:hypothetical protein [Cyclobacteriaceae bacterium]
MNHGLNRIGIALGIALIAGLILESIIYLRIGADTLWGLQSYSKWLICLSAGTYTWHFIVLKYFHVKKFELAFWSTVITILATGFQTFISFELLSGNREVVPLLRIAVVIISAVNLVRGASLVFSQANERKWLKIGGIVLLAIGAAGLVPQIQQAAMIAVQLVPIFFILNFRDEIRSDGNEHQPRQSPLDLGLTIAGTICILAMLAFGLTISGQAWAKVARTNSLVVQAQAWHKAFGSRTYSNSIDTLDYTLILPLDYDSTKRYPLVVTLPYGGSIEGCPPAQMFLADDIRSKYPSFIFIPFSREKTSWGGVPGMRTIDTIVFETIDKLKKDFKSIDPKKVYVTGVSKGAYGSWHFITARPDIFAAAIPVCGEGNPQYASHLTDVAVWAFHGEDDPNVPVKGSREMIAAIKNAGGNARYTEFPGQGHHIWELVIQTPGLLDWLFKQEKGSGPTAPSTLP